MAKIHGKNARVYLNGVDISNYQTQTDGARTLDTADKSAFGDTDKSYLTGLEAGTMKLTGFWDDDASAAGLDALFDGLKSGAAAMLVCLNEAGQDGDALNGVA